VKSVRKTRAAQQTSGEKLVRLKHEFNEAMALVQHVFTRERAKRESHKNNYIALSHKMKFATVKRQNPLLGAEQHKEDMELLFSDRKRSECVTFLLSRALAILNFLTLGNARLPLQGKR
jgi:hypothetical protein